MLTRTLVLACAFLMSTAVFAADSREVFSCDAPGLVPADASVVGHGFALDLGQAAQNVAAGSARREYDFPNSRARVSFLVRYLPATASKPASVELSKTFFTRSGDHWALMLSFTSPQTLEQPIPENTIFVFRTQGSDDVPEFTLECQRRFERGDTDCSTCR